jgi:hypothetical protein
MKVLQEMKQLQINGKKYDYPKTKFHICQQIITGGLLDLLGHVDLILKYSIGSENLSIPPNEVM